MRNVDYADFMYLRMTFPVMSYWSQMHFYNKGKNVLTFMFFVNAQLPKVWVATPLSLHNS